MDCTAIILAGGKSSRMGTNKALLPIFEKTTIEHIVDCCKHVADEIIVVTNEQDQYAFLQVPLVCDEFKECGPLGGLEAGLQAAKYDKCILIACDMPFVSSEVIKHLMYHLHNYDAVLPNVNGKLHPLFAAYRKTCLTPIRKRLQNNTLRMVGLLDEVNTKILTEDELPLMDFNIQNVFFNMNKPDEFRMAQKLASDLKKSSKSSM